jgi:hypothetical protein
MALKAAMCISVLLQTPLPAGDTNLPAQVPSESKVNTNGTAPMTVTNAPAVPALADITIRGTPYFAMIQYEGDRPVLWISIKDVFNTKHLAMIECVDKTCTDTNYMLILRGKVFAAKTNRTESVLSGKLDLQGLNGTREVVYPAKLRIGPDPLHNLIAHPHHSGMF